MRYMEIDWKGDVAKRLMAASAKLKRLDPLLNALGQTVANSVQKNFEEQRTPEGKKWPHLAHPRPGGGTMALYGTKSNALYNSIRYSISGANAVKIGYTAWYGKFHQDGVPGPWAINARKAKFLRFWGGDGWVFRKAVFHPGVKQRKFLGVRKGDIPPEVNKFVEVAFSSGATVGPRK